MNILVIEDEIKTGKALMRMIQTIRPGSVVQGPLQKVSAAVVYLQQYQQPDLVFMDIQLADGLSFEIFKQVEITCPVIFCTAFNEYALDAFRANGVDYILKPFSPDAIKAAFDKLDKLGLSPKLQQPDAALIAKLLQLREPEQWKQSFLVYQHGKYQPVPTANIAYIFVRNETTTIVTNAHEQYAIDQSLEETGGQLDPKLFFRINRRYLVSFRAIKEVEHYFARKLLLKLTLPTEEKLLVGKDKVTAFLSWLDKR